MVQGTLPAIKKIPETMNLKDPLVQFAIQKVGHKIQVGEKIEIPEDVRPIVNPKNNLRLSKYETKQRLIWITSQIVWG